MFLAGWHVGDGQRYFCGSPGRNSQAPALDGGKMAADGVHRFNGRAAGDQRVIRRLQVFEAHAGNNRQFGQRRASAGEKKENDACARRRRRSKERIASAARQLSAFGLGWPATKYSQARNRRGRFRGSRDDSPELGRVRKK